MTQSPHLRSSLSFLLFLLMSSLPPHFHCVTLDESEDWLDNLQPDSYRLMLHLDPNQSTYNGSVSIIFTCITPTDKIQLHAHQSLDIPMSQVLITSFSYPEVEIAAVTRDGRRGRVTVHLTRKMDVMKTYQVMMYFSGKIATAEHWGLFRNRYVDRTTGELRWYMATKLKPGVASRLFPCFDTTLYKTPFDISVTRPNVSNMFVLSNSLLKFSMKEPLQKGRVWEGFHLTPPMLPSSVGLVLSNLQQMELESETVRIRMYVRKELQNILKPLLNQFKEQLHFQQHYLGHSLPVDKIDVVALPNLTLDTDVSSLGLIVISDMYMPDDWAALRGLLDQWFIHFVSPLSFDSSFNQALHKFFFWQSGLTTWSPGQHLDGLFDDHISPKMHTETYEWLFRMLNYTLTEHSVRAGFRRFVKHRMNSTYSPRVLWYFMTNAAHKDGTLDRSVTVEDIVHSWTETNEDPVASDIFKNEDKIESWSVTYHDAVSTGNTKQGETNLRPRMELQPIVTVIRNYEENTAIAVQHLFTRQTNDVNSLWYIPITYLTPNDADISSVHPVTWMKKERYINMTGLPGDDDFIIVNPEFAGKFPVNYDEWNWQLLAKHLASKRRSSVPALTRSKLLQDAWNIAYAGKLSMATALDMTLFLSIETSQDVWEPFIYLLLEFLQYVADTPVEEKLENYILKQLLLAKSHGENWVSEEMLCQLGHEPCISKSREAYLKWMQDSSDINFQLTYGQFCDTFKWGNMEEYEFGIKELIKHEDLYEWQYSNLFNLLQSLAVCPTEAEKINRFFSIIFVEINGNITTDDIITILFSFKRHGRAQWTTILEFVSHNFKYVKERVEHWPHVWNLLIDQVTKHFITQEGLNKVKTLHSSHRGQFGSAEHVIRSAEKAVAAEVDWSRRNLVPMEKWLDYNLAVNRDK